MLKGKKILSPLFIFIIFVYTLLGTVSLVDNKPKIDEYRNHIPVLQVMDHMGYIAYIFSDEYNAANTPLPYLLPHLVFKILSIEANLFIPRLINILVSLSCIIFFIILLNKINSVNDYRVLIFLFYPYFIKTSFVFYLSLYGVFFLLLSLLFLSKDDNKNSFYAGVSAAGGILSQQFIFGLSLGYLINWFGHKKAGKSYKKLVLFLLPLFIPLLLFFFWGGLTHPRWRFHNPSIDLTHITAALTVTGGVFFPFVLDKLKEVKVKSVLIVLTFSLILTLFFSPLWAEYGEFGQVTGYTYNFLTKLGTISIVIYYVVETVLCFIGIYLFIILFKQKKVVLEQLIFWVASVFLLIFFFDNVFSERHLLPMMALLFLLTLPRIQNKWILDTWVIYQVLFGATYYYYWIFIHPSFV